ncbi:MAG: adenylate/guanylate cyclase protein [Solirubrobacterales bacterium]|jgi:adenylate cyclase|nr:adenylate/guanylate cyclase protein [Solirubrobacterales bacterium]
MPSHDGPSAYAPAMDDPGALDLLDGLEGPARAEREELLAWLREEGLADEAELARATGNGTIVLVGAARALGTGERYTAREVAETGGVPLELWLALTRASGLTVPADVDAVQYGETDVEAARTTRRFLDAGLGPDQLTATTRVLGRGLAQTAELMRQTVMELALAPGVSEKQLAQTYAGVARNLVPLVGPLVEQMLLIHLNHAVREEVVTADERQAGSLPGAREVSVAFADLVGFTRLGEELPPDALERVAERLGHLAGQVVEAPVRYVKSIGDAVLLVSPDPVRLVATAHALLEAAEAEGEEFPQLRVGVASGPAVTRAGDWFGRPVNLASRITTVARAGSVVADHATRKAIGDAGGFDWSFVAERRLKGVPAPVKLHRARPRGAPA